MAPGYKIPDKNKGKGYLLAFISVLDNQQLEYLMAEIRAILIKRKNGDNNQDIMSL